MRERRIRRRLLRVLLRKELYSIDPDIEPIPDSFAPAYVLLVQQHVRRRFARAVRALATWRLWELPWRVLEVLMRAGQLSVTNLLVGSYVNEAALRREMEAGLGGPDRHPEA